MVNLTVRNKLFAAASKVEEGEGRKEGSREGEEGMMPGAGGGRAGD